MTIDEAISIMNVIVHMLEPQYDTDRIEKAVEMAIKALENQPTDAVDRVTIKEYLESFGKDTNVSATDCISRQAILDAIDRIYPNALYNRAAYAELCNVVVNSPSVKTQQKTGHWITTRTFMHDGEYYCDRCKCDAPNNEKWDYCPNCGAKMQGVEE